MVATELPKMTKKQPPTSSEIIDSLGDGLYAKGESMIAIRFETTQTDDDIRYVFDQCSRELETASKLYGVNESPFFFCFPQWDNATRELYEIPEARAFAKRLNDFGLMGILNFKQALDSPETPLAGKIFLYCILKGKSEFSNTEDKKAFDSMLLQAYAALNEFIGKVKP